MIRDQKPDKTKREDEQRVDPDRGVAKGKEKIPDLETQTPGGSDPGLRPGAMQPGGSPEGIKKHMGPEGGPEGAESSGSVKKGGRDAQPA